MTGGVLALIVLHGLVQNASEMECFLCSLEISEIHGTAKYQNRCCK